MTVGTVQAPILLPPLKEYLEACEKRFTNCLAPLDEQVTIDGTNANVTLHFGFFWDFCGSLSN